MDPEIPSEFRDAVEQVRDLARSDLHEAELTLDRIPDPADAYTSETFRTAAKQMYSAGLHKLALPTEIGGLGAPPPVRLRALEEIAYSAPGLASTILVAATGASATNLYQLHERNEVLRDYVEAFVADDQGRHSGAWAITEPNVGSDIFEFDRTELRFEASAERTTGGWRLDGAKSGFISNGWLADMFLLMVNVEPARGMEGTGTFLVPGDLPGLRRSKPLDKVGLRALNQAAVIFEGVEVPEEYCIVPPGPQYRPLFESIVTGGNTGVGIIALGVARAAYDAGLAYARDRRQGGKQLIEHQLVAKKLFDAYRAIEASRLMLYRSAELLARGEGDMKVSFAARVQACETCAQVTTEMAQVHGGNGIRREHLVEKLYRDAKPLQIMDGTVERVSMHAAPLL